MKFICICTLVLFSLCCNCYVNASTAIPSPSLDNINGTWIGSCKTYICMRLEIDPQGKGIVIFKSEFTEESIYEIVSIKTKSYEIIFQLLPLENTGQSATLEGIAYPANPREMRLKFKKNSWNESQEVGLTNEKSQIEIIEQLKAASQKYHTEKGR